MGVFLPLPCSLHPSWDREWEFGKGSGRGSGKGVWCREGNHTYSVAISGKRVWCRERGSSAIVMHPRHFGWLP